MDGDCWWLPQTRHNEDGPPGHTIDGASVHLTLRERLLQSRMLAGTDGIQLIEVHNEVVRQGHLLVELVREVQMVQEIHTQFWRQQTGHKGGLSTALSTNQRRHTLIAMKRVHLKPVGHSRADPDG